MKIYAIKTRQGYLATQGKHYWFQDKPNGWAAFTTEEGARDVAEAHHSAIGTKPEEGYQLEEIRRPQPRQDQGPKPSDHTPGPWGFHWETDEKDWALVMAGGKAGRIIANVNTSSCPDSASAPAFVKMPAEANARLIAAAPDLLEALKSCITDPGSVALSRHAKEGAIRRLEHISEIARAAISKINP